MKNNELKPCPACGGEAGLKPYSGDGNSCLGLSYAHVACMSCKLTSKTFQRVYQNEHEKTDAIKAWNNRPIEDDLKRQLAEAQELVKGLAWKEKLLFSAVNYIDEFVNFSKFEVDEHVKENMNAVLATYEVLKKGEK